MVAVVGYSERQHNNSKRTHGVDGSGYHEYYRSYNTTNETNNVNSAKKGKILEARQRTDRVNGVRESLRRTSQPEPEGIQGSLSESLKPITQGSVV